MIDIATALASLEPTSQWVLRGEEIEWLDTEKTQPTDLEIQAEIARLTYLDSIQRYQKDRVYPSLAEQLDQIYHEGVDAWKVTIASVKNAHPKVEPVDADKQAAIDTHVATYTFNQQLAAYKTATARLAQYVVSVGRAEVTENDVITVTEVEAVEATVTRWVYSDDMEADPTEETIENPLITTDVAERATAQAVVDATPQPVKDAA